MDEDKQKRISNGVKVLLVNFSAEILKDIVLELQKKSVEVVYWTGAKNDFDKFSQDKENFPNTIFHDYFDAVRAIPAPGVDISEFQPPGRDILKKLAECENFTIPMMNRIDFTEEMSVYDRKHLYHEYVRYWYGVLNKYKPEAIIFSSIPHIVYNYVLYSVAKMMGIKTIMYRPLQITSRVLFFNDFKEYKVLGEVYDEIKDSNIDLSSLSVDIQSYYNYQIDPNKDSTPWYRKESYVKQKSRQTQLAPSVSSVLKSLLKFDFLKKLHFHFFAKSRLFSVDQDNYYSPWRLKKWQYRWKKNRRGFENEYRSLQTEVDFNKKFVYIPLANQPECSTNPLGGIYDDQILMVQTVADSIPDDWVIYVKETPLQWKWRLSHLGRYKGYYKKLSKINKVYLAPPEVSTYDLIDKMQTVATVTGTAAWEGLLRGKPALIFGYPWFMHCDGIFKISDVETCQNAIGKIIDGYQPSKQKFINFLAAIDKTTIEAYFYDKFKLKDSNISYEDNIKNIVEAMHKEIVK
ncbi:capsular biosynthesis protein [bacterium]|nr:capsular biosynthesis protein [bacterium]